MSSTNEELHPPPKPRASPLDYRNTDLVSRLLAATPPYLYNMPLVPNSYFFSEMLRSFVQAKSENNQNRGPPPFHNRRSRKRPWVQTRNDYGPKEAQTLEKNETNLNNWHKERFNFEQRKRESEEKVAKIEEKAEDKPEIPIYPQQLNQNYGQDTSHSNMVLPPPPPMWYPPLYPTPYGIDPLHFFIDLRVSGHIYDRKNGKDNSTASSNVSQSPQVGSNITSSNSNPNSPNLIPSPQNLNVNLSQNPSLNLSQTQSSTNLGQSSNISAPSPHDLITKYDDKTLDESNRQLFKQSRHSSAFSVPNPSPKNLPINLSNDRPEGKIKFDVKSMGFDKSKTNINYIMTNLNTIYKKLHDECKEEKKEYIDVGENISDDYKIDVKSIDLEDGAKESENLNYSRVKNNESHTQKKYSPTSEVLPQKSYMDYKNVHNYRQIENYKMNNYGKDMENYKDLQNLQLYKNVQDVQNMANFNKKSAENYNEIYKNYKDVNFQDYKNLLKNVERQSDVNSPDIQKGKQHRICENYNKQNKFYKDNFESYKANKEFQTYPSYNYKDIQKYVDDEHYKCLQTNEEEETKVDYSQNKEVLKPVDSVDEVSKSKENVSGDKEETEEERRKRVKDLQALIGLELVVDYMNHAKPGQNANTEVNSSESSSEVESVGSPPVEVVSIEEEEEQSQDL